MIRKIIRALKKAVVFILILSAAFLIVISIINIRDFFKKGDKISIIIDSGTGIETGTILAIAKALYSSELEVIALASSQWNTHQDAPADPVGVSQQLNKTLLDICGKTQIPALKGSEKPFYPSQKKIQTLSEASKYYIKIASELKKDEKVNIVFFGALTNIAFAINAEPSLASRFRIYCIAMKYDFKNNIWNKNEPNVRNDLDAIDFLLNTPELEMHILPLNLTDGFDFSGTEIFNLIEEKKELWNLLIKQWKSPYHEYPTLPMPEIALTEALINPRYVKTIQVNNPPENIRKKQMFIVISIKQ